MLLLECVDWLYSSHKPVNMLWWNHIPYTNVQRWNDTLWAWVHLLMSAGQLFNSKFCLHLPSFFCAAWKWETTHKWTMQVICMSSNVLDSRELPAPWSIQTKWKPLGYITKYIELFQNWLTFINWVWSPASVENLSQTSVPITCNTVVQNLMWNWLQSLNRWRF